MPINLGSGAISAAYVGSNAVAAAYLGSTSVYTAGGGGITPNTDAIARLYLPAATTSLTIGVMTSSGFWYMTDGTNTSSIAGGNYSAATSQYYANQYNQSNNKTTLSGMSPRRLRWCRLFLAIQVERPRVTSGAFSSSVTAATLTL